MHNKQQDPSKFNWNLNFDCTCHCWRPKPSSWVYRSYPMLLQSWGFWINPIS